MVLDAIQDQYDFNGHIYKRFVTELKVFCPHRPNSCLDRMLTTDWKATLDPNGIIAPGKQGIWPKKVLPLRQ